MAKKNSSKMSKIDWVAISLLLVGGLNWGLAVLDFNLVEAILGSLAKVAYALVGASAIYSAYKLFVK